MEEEVASKSPSPPPPPSPSKKTKKTQDNLGAVVKKAITRLGVEEAAKKNQMYVFLYINANLLLTSIYSIILSSGEEDNAPSGAKMVSHKLRPNKLLGRKVL